MRISDWSSDVCSSDLTRRWWRCPGRTSTWPRSAATRRRWRASVGMPAGGSWLRAPVGVDARDGAGHVGLAVDHVASIDHHGGNLGDAQPPGIRDTLVGMADAVLQGLAAVMQQIGRENV